MATRNPSTAGDQFAVALPFDPAAARTARLMVANLLVDHDCPPRLVEDGRLVVHELVMNGVTHGRPDPRDELEVSCQVLDAQVLISVLDQGLLGAVEVQPKSRSRTSGRGLALVDALSASWSVDRTTGTRVSAWLSR